MIDRPNVDYIFTDKFFTVPARRDLDLFKCDFRLPTSTTTMRGFFTNPIGYNYCVGVKRILDRLRKLATLNHISMSALDVFYGNINHQSSNTEHHFPYTVVSFQLLTEGVKMLNAVTVLLESDTVNPDLKVQVLASLGKELDVCAPGCYTIIQNNYLKLIKNPAVSLLEIRREIAQQVVQEVLNEYNDSLIGTAYYDSHHVYEGNHTHYIAAILNAYAAEFGFEISVDEYMPRYAEITRFLDLFYDKFTAQLRGDIIINRIVDKLNLGDVFAKIKRSPDKAAEYCDALKDQMDNYGQDESFNLNYIFDQDKLAASTYELSEYAIDNLIISILWRLSNSGFLNAEFALRKQLIQPDVALYYFPFHSLSFSYVIDSSTRERKPFIEYCVAYYKVNRYLPMVLEDVQQARELHHQVAKSIEREDIAILIPNTATDDLDRMHYYTLARALPHATMLAKVLEWVPDNVFNEFHHTIGEMHKRVKFQDAVQFASAIQEHFSKRRFYFNDIQTMYALAKEVKSFHDLSTVMYFIAENARIQFLLMMGMKAMLLIVSDAKNIRAMLPMFRVDDRRHFIHYIHFSSPVVVQLSLSDLISILGFLPENDYDEFINIIIGIDKMSSLIPDFDTFLAAISSLPVNGRMPFIKAVKTEFIAPILNGTIIINLGRIMACLSVSDQIVLLTEWYPNNINQLFPSFEFLQAYLSPLQPDVRLAFTCSLAADFLQQLLSDAQTVGKLFQLIPENQLIEMINHITPMHLKSLIVNHEQLSMVLSFLSYSARAHFIKDFRACYADDSELDCFKSDDNVIYNELIRARQPSSMGSFASYIGSFFSSSSASSASSTPHASTTNILQRREAAKMMRYDCR